MIAIVAPQDDYHARAVRERLTYLGEKVVQLDAATLLSKPFSVRVETPRPRTVAIDTPAGDLLADVRSIWYRRIGMPKIDMTLEPDARWFAHTESVAALMSATQILDERSFAVNPFTAGLVTERGAGKLHQLVVAQRRDFAVPRTLATNDPDEAREFIRSCEHGAVYKPFLAPVVKESGEKRRRQTLFTNRLDDAALAKLDGVRAAPCLFQEAIEKDYELRVTVIGRKVFATEIRSQETKKGTVDFRRAYDELSYRAVPFLPISVCHALLEIMEDLGLVFGCVDMIVTPAGDYVFLEVNQQGQWLWLEEKTGQPLLANFCAMLAAGDEDYECDAPQHAPGVFATM